MRRPGITLLEVLSAIFITGIGLLSLLVLFPLGALKMAEALQDDRTALAAKNGQSVANATDMRPDPDVQTAMLNQANIPGATIAPPFPPAQTPTADGPGYPVLVDPIGTLAYTGQGNWPTWVAGKPNNVNVQIPRVRGQWMKAANPLFPPVTSDYLRWCTVQDDLAFNDDGPYQGLTAEPPLWITVGGAVQRNLRYSYAWMLRMPRAGAPNVVDVSVLVFSGRSINLVGFGTQETAVPAVFNAQANTVALYTPAGATEPPSLRRGQWILDASSGVNPNNNTLSVRGFFYRIVSVSDLAVDANNNQYVNVEVQTPLRGWLTIDPAFQTTPIAGGPAAPGQLGSVVIFDNLVEVFDDGTF